MIYIRIRTPFCGCGDLKSVTIAIGIIYLIIALTGATTGFGYVPGDTDGYGYGSYGENYFLLLLGISCIIWIFANVSLMYGAIARQCKFLLPWLFWNVIFQFLALAELIWSSILLGKISGHSNTRLESAMIAVLCCVLPFLCTFIYFSIVVYSFYCDVKEVESNMTYAPDLPELPLPPSSNDKEIRERKLTWVSQVPQSTGNVSAHIAQMQTVLPSIQKVESHQEDDSFDEASVQDHHHYYSVPANS